MRCRRVRKLLLLALSGLLLVFGIGLGLWVKQAIAVEGLRCQFLVLAAQKGRDTAVFADWMMPQGSLRALDFVRRRSATIYRPAESETLSSASTSPVSPLCAFLSEEAGDKGNIIFRRVKLLDMESLRVEQEIALPDNAYAYDQPPAWSHDGRQLAVACISNRTGPEVVVIRIGEQGPIVEKRLAIPREVARQQPFAVWGADTATLYLSVGRRGDSLRSFVLDLRTGKIEQSPYSGQVVDSVADGRLLVWVPDKGFVITSPKSGVAEMVGWPLGTAHRLWEQEHYLLFYGGYEGVFSLAELRPGPIPEHIQVYDTERRITAKLVGLWHGPPPGDLSLTRSAWIGRSVPGFQWSPWSAESGRSEAGPQGGR